MVAWRGGLSAGVTNVCVGHYDRPRYTRRVRSVVDILKQRTRDTVWAMSPAERIELAFALGEDDLAVYMRAHRVDRAAALAVFRSTRQIGRRSSAAARGERP